MIDINIIRGVTTAILLFAFIGLVIWIYSSKRKSFFDDAAQIPFENFHKKKKDTKQENEQ